MSSVVHKCCCQLDILIHGNDNGVMKRNGHFDSSDSGEAADDLQAVLDSIASKTPLDPKLELRVHARAEKITQEAFERHGLLDVAVDLVREARDEE
jgi:hypothetical protein